MAVYTQVSETEVSGFLQAYDVGEVRAFRGIEEGVENSNFYLETDTSRFVLTLYEKRVREEDLPFFISLMQHLTVKGMPTAAPIADKSGAYLRRLNGRPAALISFLEGNAKSRLNTEECAACGEALAKMQSATNDFAMVRANNLSLAGWSKLATKCGTDANNCSDGLADFLQEELTFLTRNWPGENSLPGGVVHADLFPDNVLFTGHEITGIIDFYFACNDFFAYDLAICLNAWAFDDSGTFLPAHAQSMLRAYESVRPLSDIEKKKMQVLLRGASLRFLLTRLYDWLNQDPNALVNVKNPLEYLTKSRFHRQTQLLDCLHG